MLDKEIIEYKNKFYKICEGKRFKNFITKYEKERKALQLKLLAHECIAILVTVLSLAVCWKFNNGFTSALFIACFMSIVLMPFKFNWEYVWKIKEKSIKKIMKILGDISWDRYGGEVISSSYIKKSKLFGEFTDRHDGDNFTGTYKDVEFDMSETSLSRKDPDKNKIFLNDYPVFKGVLLKMKLNKNFKGCTIIASKGDFMIQERKFAFGFRILLFLFYVFFVYVCFAKSLLVNVSLTEIILLYWVPVTVIFVILFIGSLFIGKKYELPQIKLEDTVFDKKYRAYSSDEVEGRYLITTAFMERFKNIQTVFGTKLVKCSFFNEYLMFSILSLKNHFEIGNLFISLDNPKQFERLFNEIISIYLLIDYFKLDEKTGL